MAEFLHLVTPEKFYEILNGQKRLTPKGSEVVTFTDSHNRIVAREVYSSVDLPPFTRSTVDGFAVRAQDTAGATETLPGYLTVVGEILMGEAAGLALCPGEAIRIPTGGMLPPGADAVMMIEYTDEVDGRTIEFSRAVAQGENTVQQGEDIRQGELLLPAGHRIRPQDIGALAGLGITEVEVFIQPEIAILSTGDELVSPYETPGAGEIRDINTYSVSAYLMEMGCKVRNLGIVRDTFDALKQTVAENLDADLIIISGGSSVGVKDMTVDVLNSFGEPGVIVHGLSIKPGKPTIMALLGDKPAVGLPGHPASAWTIFNIMVKPIVQTLQGERREPGLSAEGTKVRAQISAVLSRNVVSDRGREEYVPVRIFADEQGGFVAEPILGKSSLITTLVKANGYIRVDTYQEGVYQGETVKVYLY